MKQFLLLLLLVAPAVFAQGTLEVISLRHRTADQVIPVLRPLLEPGGVLSGQFDSLIVRTGPENLAQIRAALDALDRPLRQRQVIRTPDGAVVTDSTAIQEAATGFEVVPRVSGSNVFLEIAPQREDFAPGHGGAIRSERMASTVSGRIGDWIELGGMGISSTRTASGILSSGDGMAAGERRIWVKVEEAGN